MACGRLLFGSAFFFIPGIGPLIVFGPLVAWIVGGLEGAVVVGGLSALGAALYGIGIPKDSIMQYETALKSDEFLVIAHGPDPFPLTGRETSLEKERHWDWAGEGGDPHLRSSAAVTGYHIAATDGDIGHVEDFLVDDARWAIRYMIVDTRNWWPGKKVLVSPNWIQRVDWSDAKVHVDMTREQIKKSPEYDPSGAVERDYETRLHDHYGRPSYWSDRHSARLMR